MPTRTCCSLLLLALTASIVGLPARAQSVPDLLPPVGAYSELFLENPKVSGNLLVGLRWAATEVAADPQYVPKFNPNAVRLPLPALAAVAACVDITSRDGRYTAENLYALRPSVGVAPAIQSRSQYQRQLRTYAVDDIAVLVRATDSCDTTGAGAIIPALLLPQKAVTAGFDDRRLVAYINAEPDRVTLRLLGPGPSDFTRDVTCRAAGEGVNIAYTTLCVVGMQEGVPGHAVTLQVATRERFKTTYTDFDILLDK